MPNTKSARKAVRSSARKRQFNSYWRKKVKESVKAVKNNVENKKVDAVILNKELLVLQKVLDKASKNNVIHKNKAKRLKSRYAKKIAALSKKNITPKEKTDQARSGDHSGRKSKS